MRLDRLEADALQVLDRASQADRPGDVGRARLELVRQVVPGAALEGHGANHVAAAEKRRHRVEEGFLPVEDADSGRSVDLVSRERVEIQRRAHARRSADDARPANHRRGPSRPRCAPCARCDRPGSRCPSAFDTCTTATIFVRGVRSRSNSSMTSSPRSSIGATRSTRARARADLLPRHDVRVVLHRRDEHLVARAEILVAPRPRHEVDRLGRVSREHDLPDRCGVHERRGRVSRAASYASVARPLNSWTPRWTFALSSS